MKVQVKVSPKVIVEAEGNKQNEVFEQLATLQEVFGQEQCGKCGNDNLRFVVREVEGNKFYELHCVKCRAKLIYGAHKSGNTLFPKRKEGDDYLPDKGWLKWDREKKEMV